MKPGPEHELTILTSSSPLTAAGLGICVALTSVLPTKLGVQHQIQDAFVVCRGPTQLGSPSLCVIPLPSFYTAGGKYLLVSDGWLFFGRAAPMDSVAKMG